MRTLLLALSLLYSLVAGANNTFTRETECENLLNAAIPFAEQMLQKQGGFYPFGAVLKSNGEMSYVAGYDGRDQPPSADIIRLIKQSFVQGAGTGQYKATILVYEVKVILPNSGLKSDAIAMSLNHSSGYSVIMLLPYELKNGQLIYGEMFSQKGEADVFQSDRNFPE